MRLNKKKNIIIAVLCGFMVLMGVGYALLAQTLTINATASINSKWDIQITNVEVKGTPVGYAEDDSENTGIGSDKISANLSANFKAPGDSITYEITVENLGTIPAEIKTTVITPTPNVNDVILVSHTANEVEELKNLQPTDVGKFTVTLTFNENVTELPLASTRNYTAQKMVESNKTYSFTITPTFEQKTPTSNGNSSSGGGSTSSQEGVFTPEPELVVASDGTLVKYNPNNSMNVVIPASFGGRNITSIGEVAFVDYNVILKNMDEENSLIDVVIYAQDKQEFDMILGQIESIFAGQTVNAEDGSANIIDVPDKYLVVKIEASGLVDEQTRLRVTSLDLSNAIYLTEIQEQVFYQCSTLSSINLGSTLTTIQESAFNETSITEITLPASLTSIGDSAFYTNYSSVTVTILGDSTRFDSNWRNIFGKDKSQFTVN